MTKHILILLLKRNMYSMKIVNKLFSKYTIQTFSMGIHRELGHVTCSIYIELLWEDQSLEVTFDDDSIINCWDKFIKYFKKLGLL